MQSSLTQFFLGTALAASLVIGTASASHAAGIPLDTNGLVDQEQILGYFNGGLAGNGSGPGPNYGVVFGSGAFNQVSVLNGGAGSFQGVPLRGPNAVLFSSSGADTIDVAGGFTSGLSFFYSSFLGGEVDIWSGLDGTGTLLASITLGANFEDHCDASATTSFCSWDEGSASFAGTAESIDFSNVADLTAIGDLTLGSAIPAPEPASLALFATGFAALGFFRRQRRA
jgi:hypothetical protein